MNMQTDLCDLDQIKLLLARHGFHFSKSLGQNFLIDRRIPEEIAAGAGITPETCILEVGPGIGALSAQLCRRGKKVVAVELDPRLPEILQETMQGYENFSLIRGDILKLDLPALCREAFQDAPAVACANLPYYITTPAISALVRSGCFQRITVMVQKEAAQRMCAAPGEEGYCAFSAQIAYFCDARTILSVPRDRFVPSPKVDSVVLSLAPHRRYVDRFPQESFERTLRAAFANRRKTLVNGICMEYGSRIEKKEACALLNRLGLPDDIRGERLSVEELGRLSLALADFMPETGKSF